MVTAGGIQKTALAAREQVPAPVSRAMTPVEGMLVLEQDNLTVNKNMKMSTNQCHLHSNLCERRNVLVEANVVSYKTVAVSYTKLPFRVKYSTSACQLPSLNLCFN